MSSRRYEVTVATTPRSYLQPFPVAYSYNSDEEWECGEREGYGSVASVVSGDSEEDSVSPLCNCWIQDSGMDGSDRS